MSFRFGLCIFRRSMLVIRKEQMAVFLRLQLKEFEDKTCERLLKLKPDQCRKLGEKAVRKSIQDGIERSFRYGIKTERDIARYINIMYTLGFDFDTDPRYPWAADILVNKEFGQIPCRPVPLRPCLFWPVLASFGH